MTTNRNHENFDFRYAYNFEELSQTRTSPKNSLAIYDKEMNAIMNKKDINGRVLTASNKTKSNRYRCGTVEAK